MLHKLAATLDLCSWCAICLCQWKRSFRLSSFVWKGSFGGTPGRCLEDHPLNTPIPALFKNPVLKLYRWMISLPGTLLILCLQLAAAPLQSRVPSWWLRLHQLHQYNPHIQFLPGPSCTPQQTSTLLSIRCWSLEAEIERLLTHTHIHTHTHIYISHVFSTW